MSERKINLSKILEAKNKLAFEEGYVNYFTAAQRNIIFKAMEESIKQSLELAAENAECKLKNKIECDSYQLENGFVTVNNSILINKQSILNTINQIE